MDTSRTYRSGKTKGRATTMANITQATWGVAAWILAATTSMPSPKEFLDIGRPPRRVINMALVRQMKPPAKAKNSKNPVGNGAKKPLSSMRHAAGYAMTGMFSRAATRDFLPRPISNTAQKTAAICRSIPRPLEESTVLRPTMGNSRSMATNMTIRTSRRPSWDSRQFILFPPRADQECRRA